MDANHYDRDTGLFLRTTSAEARPLEPDFAVFPAYSTPAPVPTPSAGHAVVFRTPEDTVPSDYQLGAWTEVLDFRGAYWQTSDGRPYNLTEVGVDPAERGLTSMEPIGVVKWSDGAWVPDLEKITAAARDRRDYLLSYASGKIAPLADAVDLGIATAAEQEAFTAWRQYRVAINRVEQQDGFPSEVVWPVAPDAQTETA